MLFDKTNSHLLFNSSMLALTGSTVSSSDSQLLLITFMCPYLKLTAESPMVLDDYFAFLGSWYVHPGMDSPLHQYCYGLCMVQTVKRNSNKYHPCPS